MSAPTIVQSYVALALGYWGRGDTEADALAQVRKSGAKKGEKTIIFLNDRPADKDKPYVSDYGDIMYHGDLKKIAEYNHGKRKEI